MVKKILIIGFMICTALLNSCSKSPANGTEISTINSDLLETEMYGTYLSILSPINKNVSGHLNGTVSVIREQANFIVDVRMSGGPLSVLHNQSIHVGSRCPTELDDLNADGYIDAEEGSQVFGKIIIPLDDDISSQRMGGGIYPISDKYGQYLWSRSTPFDKLMQDLHEEDINLKDDFIKLEHNKNLTMLGKVVVILGIPETNFLPETVAGRGRLTPHQALPIACGVIRRLTTTSPGQIDTDYTGIPLPQGETIGGSSGVDDGAIFNQGGINNNSGNYGEDEDIEITNETEHGTTSGAII